MYVKGEKWLFSVFYIVAWFYYSLVCLHWSVLDVCTPLDLTWLLDNLHLETCLILLQALATTNWASENGTRDQLRVSRGGTNHRALRLKTRGLAENSKEEEKKGEERRRRFGGTKRPAGPWHGVLGVESQINSISSVQLYAFNNCKIHLNCFTLNSGSLVSSVLLSSQLNKNPHLSPLCIFHF